MGSFLIDKRYKELGLRSEFQSWLGYSHVPFIGGLNIEALFSTNPLALIFNPYVLDSTKRHIANFCYSLIECDERITGIKQQVIASNLSVFPNPTAGNFNIQLPKEISVNKWNVGIYDVAGKELFTSEFSSNSSFVTINEKLPPGMYFIKLQYEKNSELHVYTGKVTITE